VATQVQFPTLWNRLTSIIVDVNRDKSRKYHNDENLIKPWNSRPWSVQLISGAPEKGTGKNLEYPYPEPAQVPLGEKPKV
jgi:hypothetical protein